MKAASFVRLKPPPAKFPVEGDRKKASRMKSRPKAATRRTASRQKVKEILEGIDRGEIAIYAGYRQLFRYCYSHNTAVPELKALFRIPELSPDGPLSVADSFKSRALAAVRSIAPQFSV